MHAEAFTTIKEDGGGPTAALGSRVADQLEIPLAVLDRRLALVWANRAARGRAGSAWAALFDAAPADAAALAVRTQLHDLVLACLRTHAESEALVEGHDGTWFATAAPLQGDPEHALLRLNAMHQAAPALRARLQRLFGLSAAEAQVTIRLASGSSLEHIAQARGVTIDTVRAQMRSIFHKTGIHRQGELICAVGKLAAN